MEIYGFYKGEKKSLTQLAAESGVSYDTLLRRYKAGVPFGVLVDTAGTGATEDDIVALRTELIAYVDAAASGSPRPNLLDNWYFVYPVNQRGQTEYTDYGYTIDRWRTWYGLSVTVGEGSIALSTSNTTWRRLDQVLERPSELNGKTATFSAWIESDDTILFTLKNLTNSKEYRKSFTAPSGVVSHTFDAADDFAQDTDDVRFQIFLSQDTTVSASATLKAVKLELGDRQTLARPDAGGNWQMNEIPSFAEQLARCQRYYLPLTTVGRYAGCVGSSSANVQFFIPTPSEFAATPTLSGLSRITFRADSGLRNTTAFTVSDVHKASNGVYVSGTPTWSETVTLAAYQGGVVAMSLVESPHAFLSAEP